MPNLIEQTLQELNSVPGVSYAITFSGTLKAYRVLKITHTPSFESSQVKLSGTNHNSLQGALIDAIKLRGVA